MAPGNDADAILRGVGFNAQFGDFIRYFHDRFEYDGNRNIF